MAGLASLLFFASAGFEMRVMTQHDGYHVRNKKAALIRQIAVND
jgi:hypothetical protein